MRIGRERPEVCAKLGSRRAPSGTGVKVTASLLPAQPCAADACARKTLFATRVADSPSPAIRNGPRLTCRWGELKTSHQGMSGGSHLLAERHQGACIMSG